VKTKKTEPGSSSPCSPPAEDRGRASGIVPDGVLFGSSKAQRSYAACWSRHKLDGVVKLPGGVFKPYARRIDRDPAVHEDRRRRHRPRGFYEVTADGWSLDDNAPTSGRVQTGPHPSEALADDEHARNNLPTHSPAGSNRDDGERSRERTPAVLLHPSPTFAAQGYDSPHRYKGSRAEEVEHRPPLGIIADLGETRTEIQQGLSDLKAIL